jgi:hypothetical protein
VCRTLRAHVRRCELFQYFAKVLPCGLFLRQVIDFWYLKRVLVVFASLTLNQHLVSMLEILKSICRALFVRASVMLQKWFMLETGTHCIYSQSFQNKKSRLTPLDSDTLPRLLVGFHLVPTLITQSSPIFGRRISSEFFGHMSARHLSRNNNRAR